VLERECSFDSAAPATGTVPRGFSESSGELAPCGRGELRSPAAITLGGYQTPAPLSPDDAGEVTSRIVLSPRCPPLLDDHRQWRQRYGRHEDASRREWPSLIPRHRPWPVPFRSVPPIAISFTRRLAFD